MLVRGFAALLLGLALINFIILYTSVPVTQSDLRRNNVEGGWRIEIGEAMFDQGTYLFQLGYGMINADVSTTGADEGVDPATLIETRSASAAEYLAESVRLDPGNTYAWAGLAWAHALDGDMAAGRAAMVTSWEIAPNNLQLASSRADFFSMVDGLTGDGAGFAMEDILEDFDEETLAEILGDDAEGLTPEDFADLTMSGGGDGDQEIFGDGAFAPVSEAEIAGTQRDLYVLSLHAEEQLRDLLQLIPSLAPLAPPLDEGAPTLN